MQLILEAIEGPARGKVFRLLAGQSASLGRSYSADFVLAEDPFLSGTHFGLELGHDRLQVRDLNSSNGTRLNGRRIHEDERITLFDGDRISAGKSTFLIKLEGAPESYSKPAPAPPPKPKPPPAAPLPPAEKTLRMPDPPPRATEDLFEILARQRGTLYAVLDGARNQEIWLLLRDAGEQHASLYEGDQALSFGEYAPFLVQLPPDCELLRTLVRLGWGDSWGVLLTSKQEFDAVRKHLRRFLLIRDTEGEQVYFRYFDPRVLRVFLPACTAEEAEEFFGPISCFLLEGRQPTELLVYMASQFGARQTNVPLKFGETVPLSLSQ